MKNEVVWTMLSKLRNTFCQLSIACNKYLHHRYLNTTYMDTELQVVQDVLHTNLLGTYFYWYRVGRRSIILGWTCGALWSGCCRLWLISATSSLFFLSFASPPLAPSALALLSILPSTFGLFSLWFLFLWRFCWFWCDEDRLVVHPLHAFGGGNTQVELTLLFFGPRSIIYGLNLKFITNRYSDYNRRTFW